MDVILAGLTLLAGTSRDVLPIVLFIFGFQAFVIRQPIPNLKHLLSGLVLVIVGLTLFLLGLEQALFPVGRLMAAQLTATGTSGASGGTRYAALSDRWRYWVDPQAPTAMNPVALQQHLHPSS